MLRRGRGFVGEAGRRRTPLLRMNRSDSRHADRGRGAPPGPSGAAPGTRRMSDAATPSPFARPLRERALRFVAAAAVPLVAGCAGAQSQAPAFPVGVTFAWVGTDAGSAPRIDVADPSRYTVRFDASGRAELRLDCNRGSSQWSRDGDRLALTPPASTKMKCPDGSLDAAFAAGLARTARWSYRDGVLVLEGGDATALRLKRLPP